MTCLQVSEVIDRFNRIDGAPSAGSEELAGNISDFPVYPRHTNLVASGGCDSASDMGAMVIAGAIEDGVVIGDKVPSVNIIDVEVAIVVFAVPLDFVRIGPDVLLQIRMEELNSFVNDSHVNGI